MTVKDYAEFCIHGAIVLLCVGIVYAIAPPIRLRSVFIGSAVYFIAGAICYYMSGKR